MITAKSPAPLTARQAEVLRKIRDFYRENGFPPKFINLMCMLEFASPNGVMCHIRPLVRKGALRRVSVNGGRGCYLPVVPEGCCPCCGRPA